MSCAHGACGQSIFLYCFYPSLFVFLLDKSLWIKTCACDHGDVSIKIFSQTQTFHTCQCMYMFTENYFHIMGSSLFQAICISPETTITAAQFTSEISFSNLIIFQNVID